MAPRTRRTLHTTLLLGLAVHLASAVPDARAVTVTFDAGSGRPEAYTEAGITVVPGANPEDHVHIGDNDGNGSPDLMLHPLCCSSPYQFTFGGARFTPASLDFVLLGGTHTFTSSSGASVTPTASGRVVFPSDGWRGITAFTWRDDGTTLDEEGVVDNLRFCPGDCDDGNACTTDGCAPDDPAADANGCVHVPNDATCDDGIFCNGADLCHDGDCVVHAGDPCHGGLECANVCEEAAGNCFTPAGAPCTDDGSVCTDDRCDGAGTCRHAAPDDAVGFTPDPPQGEGGECEEDADACTDDVCRSGVCVHERLVEPSDCTLLQDVFRQALSLGVQVDGLAALVGEDGPADLVGILARIRDDLTAGARALGGKVKSAPAAFESPFLHRVRLALVVVKRVQPRIVTFLGILDRSGVRARLDADVAAEVERRGRLLNQGVRSLKADLRKLRRTFATLVRSRGLDGR
jgi:hypothetical protein